VTTGGGGRGGATVARGLGVGWVLAVALATTVDDFAGGTAALEGARNGGADVQAAPSALVTKRADASRAKRRG
jgi:hypothetical protein